MKLDQIMESSDFDAALKSWVALVQKKLIDGVRNKGLDKALHYELSIDPKGKKYVRIVISNSGGENGSVFCFIEKSSGNILKAAGWKTPAKGARGNIYADDPLKGVTEYGAAYR